MGCIEKRGHFTGSDGKNRIAYITWEPTVPPRAVLQISHGMCEYMDRYREFAEMLTEKGYLVCGNDHLGHGNSVADAQDLGYFGPVEGWRFMVDDLHLMSQRIKEEAEGKYEKLPYIMLGHSMGSFLSRAYISWYGDELTGSVVMGTSGSQKMLPVAIAGTKLLMAVKGPRYRSDYINSMTLGAYNAKFKPSRTEYDWLSTDEKEVDSYKADPLCTFIFTLNGFMDLFEMLKFVAKDQWYREVPKDHPILLLGGSDDPVGAQGKGVLEVHRKLSESGHNRLVMKLYENCRHELLNERNRRQIFADIADWMEPLVQSRTVDLK